MPSIKVRTSDGEVIDIDTEIAKISGTLKTMLNDLGAIPDGVNQEPLPLDVRSDLLRKILEWTNFHKDDPHTEELDLVENLDQNGVLRSDDISEWDMSFLKIGTHALFELLGAAHYLDIKDLQIAGSKTVANMIKGKSVEEIRAAFNLNQDNVGNNRDDDDDHAVPPAH